jgi:hypothetical protein
MCTLGDAADVNPVIKFLRHALLTPHSTGYTYSLNHGTENLSTLHFNGKI